MEDSILFFWGGKPRGHKDNSWLGNTATMAKCFDYLGKIIGVTLDTPNSRLKTFFDHPEISFIIGCFAETYCRESINFTCPSIIATINSYRQDYFKRV